MKKQVKKYLTLIVICITLTGCTLQYNIELDKNSINEKIVLQIQNNKLDSISFNKLTSDSNSVYLNDNQYYNVKYDTQNNISKFTYTYKHDINNYQNAKILNRCYRTNNVKKENNKITIDMKGIFNCANKESNTYIDEAQINITTKLKVTENNADEIKNNTYTWNINQSNYQNKPIHLVANIPKDNTNLINETKNLIILVLFFVIPITIIGIIIYTKHKKRNKI